MPPAATARPFWKLIDWRLVAAVGLPLWAFLFGMLVTWKPARGSPPAAVAAGPTEPTPPAVEPAPAPREVVVRSEVVPLPVVVPVLPAEPTEVAAPVPPAEPEFNLPASEFVPADRCKTFNTRVRFHAGLPEAAAEAKTSKKMLLVLHISGNFDDPGFT
jgi:hypothetical protein